MSALRWLWAGILAGLAGLSCGYRDTLTAKGIPNLHRFGGEDRGQLWGMYRTGLPTTPAAWDELRRYVEVPGRQVVRVVLHSASEGSEEVPASFGWTIVWAPLPPEEDQPLTVFTRPARKDVEKIVDTILTAHEAGKVVVWGCVHGRDRTGVISALVGMRLLGWSKEQAWKYAVDTGLRWELPGLDAYWLEDVP